MRSGCSFHTIVRIAKKTARRSFLLCTLHGVFDFVAQCVIHAFGFDSIAKRWNRSRGRERSRRRYSGRYRRGCIGCRRGDRMRRGSWSGLCSGRSHGSRPRRGNSRSGRGCARNQGGHIRATLHIHQQRARHVVFHDRTFDASACIFWQHPQPSNDRILLGIFSSLEGCRHTVIVGRCHSKAPYASRAEAP